MIWVFVLIFVQVAIAGIVIFVLKRLLDRELVRAALEKLQAAVIAPQTTEVTVKFGSPLSEQTRAQVQAVISRKSPSTKTVFIQDPGLKGGLVIEIPGAVMDFSVSARLRNFWSA